MVKVVSSVAFSKISSKYVRILHPFEPIKLFFIKILRGIKHRPYFNQTPTDYSFFWLFAWERTTNTVLAERIRLSISVIILIIPFNQQVEAKDISVSKSFCLKWISSFIKDSSAHFVPEKPKCQYFDQLKSDLWNKFWNPWHRSIGFL